MYADDRPKTSINVQTLKVSLIICCHSMERIADIVQAIDSAMNQTFSSCEVIVAVDYNDALVQRLKTDISQTVQIVSNTGIKGLSDTRNAGIQAATGDIIAFTDDDATAAPDCIEKLVQQYRVRSVVAVGGRSIPVWRNERPGWFPKELDWIVGSTYKGAPESVQQVNRIIGCNMSFRKEVFKEVGLFKTELGRVGRSGEGEDSEICMRIRQRIHGSLILYEPAAVVYHKVPPERASWKYLISRSYSGGLAVAEISRLYSATNDSSLSTGTERNYLQYMVSTALPERLKRIYRLTSIAQTIAILVSITATAAGFLVGKIRNIWKAED